MTEIEKQNLIQELKEKYFKIYEELPVGVQDILDEIKLYDKLF